MNFEAGQALRHPAQINYTMVEAALYELKLLAPLADSGEITRRPPAGQMSVVCP